MTELHKKLCHGDPVQGVWNVPKEPTPVRLWYDASNLAYGAALEVDGNVVEDCSWLRQASDKRHINIAELEAAIRGLTLAVKWGVKDFQLATDSKTVASWIQQVVHNTKRVKISGMHEVLVQRRLQIIHDLIASTGLTVEIVWVPIENNRADQLTRVPLHWISYVKSFESTDPEVAAAACLSVVGPVTLEGIGKAQKASPLFKSVLAEINTGLPVTASCFKKVREQLCAEDGVLM